MSSDWSAGEGFDETLAVFTEATVPSEPRTTAEVVSAVDTDEKIVRDHLRRLVDEEELRSKTLETGTRLWWRPASAVDGSFSSNTTYFDKILSHSPDYVLIVDEAGEVKYNSPPVEAVLGRKPEDLVGIDSFSNVHPEDRAAAKNAYFELLADAADEMTVEFRAKHADGSWRWVEVTGVDKRSDPVINGALLNVRDITARKQREKEIRETTRRLQAVLDTIESAVFMKDTEGHYLLMNQTCRELFDVSAETDISTLTDEELFDPETAAAVRADDKRVFSEGSTIAVEEEIPVADGVRTHLTRKTPMFDETGESDALCGVSTDITEQKAREQRLKQQRADLAALNSLNRVFREITDTVLEQSTRSEIEQTLCTQLVASDSYRTAFLAEVAPSTEEVTLCAKAGPQAVFDALRIQTMISNPTDQSPAGVAFRSGTLTVVEDVESSPAFAASTDELTSRGIRSFAAVPIGHESTQYGILGVFTERPDAFGPHEQAVLGQLGEVVGHAIATSERQRALLSDETIELSFRVDSLIDQFDLSVSVDGRISYTRSVPVGDGGFLVYGTATEDSIRLLEALVEADTADHWQSVTVLGTEDGVIRFELTLSEHPVLSTVSAQAGYIHEAIFENGTFNMTFHFAPSADIQQAIDSVKTAYPEATLLTRSRTVRPARQPQRPIEVLSERLTERQLAALEAAYGAGFFNWPRDSSGEALAESLGISPSTYHQHLRKAQQTLMEIIFDEDSG